MHWFYLQKLEFCPFCGHVKTVGDATCNRFYECRSWRGPERIQLLTMTNCQLQFLDDMSYCKVMHIPTIYDVTPGDAIIALGRLLKAVQG